MREASTSSSVPGDSSLRAPILRGPHARERVLRAALEVLAERGMSGFTMEAVAEQAQASKATVYRHWKSRISLLVDAMDLAFPPFPPPASGNLRRDLTDLLAGQEALLQRGPFARLLAAVIDAAEREPALAALHFDLTERRRQPVLETLRQARGRGEIPPDADLELAVDLLAGPAFYRRLIAHRDLPAGYTAAILDHVLRALGAPGAPHHGPGARNV